MVNLGGAVWRWQHHIWNQAVYVLVEEPPCPEVDAGFPDVTLEFGQHEDTEQGRQDEEQTAEQHPLED